MTSAAVPLSEAHDASRFGGKAAALATALGHLLPVPPGIALDAELVLRAAEGDRHAHAACVAARAVLGEALVAVRSSAIGEDGVSASFAGQHLTRLGVATADEMLEAIRDAWHAGRSAAALAYRRKLGIDGEPLMAVIVQVMVDAECAGVLFTKNPIDGADERVIEAAWGLGETVVAGLVVPDRYRLARDGTVVEASAGDKDVASRLDPKGGSALQPVAPELRHALCLDEERIAALAALAAACERIDPAAQDIEWAFESRQLFLMQRRPITR